MNRVAQPWAHEGSSAYVRVYRTEFPPGVLVKLLCVAAAACSAQRGTDTRPCAANMLHPAQSITPKHTGVGLERWRAHLREHLQRAVSLARDPAVVVGHVRFACHRGCAVRACYAPSPGVAVRRGRMRDPVVDGEMDGTMDGAVDGAVAARLRS
jgi:hypothetical protein